MTNRGDVNDGREGAQQAGADAVKQGAAKQGNLRMVGKLCLFVALMFGFGWAMIPLYNAICDATGLNFLTKRDDGAEKFAKSTQVDLSRTVVIEFDSNSHGPWRFKPEQASIKVHPGELATVEYELINTVDRQVAGQAIPSYAPLIGARYFRKIECFCFSQQLMQPNESKRFPVVFVIDPELPKDVTTITLSYTFYDVSGPIDQKSAGAAPARNGGRT